NLVAVEIRHRNLGSRYEVEVVFRIAIEVVAELRKVSRSVEAFLAHHRRRINLGVAVLARVKVEHERDERALKARTVTLEDIKARAGDLYAALKIDDAERLAEVRVRARLEVEDARRSL